MAVLDDLFGLKSLEIERIIYFQKIVFDAILDKV